MKVHELIEALRRLPPDLPVFYSDEEYGHEPVDEVNLVDPDERPDLASYEADWGLPRRVVLE